MFKLLESCDWCLANSLKIPPASALGMFINKSNTLSEFFCLVAICETYQH